MVSEAGDEMKQAFINTQSNAISRCDLARRPVLRRVRATDTLLYNASSAQTYATPGGTDQSAAVEGKQTHGGRPESLISLISCGTKDHLERFGSCDLADAVGYEKKKQGQNNVKFST